MHCIHHPSSIIHISSCIIVIHHHHPSNRRYAHARPEPRKAPVPGFWAHVRAENGSEGIISTMVRMRNLKLPIYICTLFEFRSHGTSHSYFKIAQHALNLFIILWIITTCPHLTPLIDADSIKTASCCI